MSDTIKLPPVQAPANPQMMIELMPDGNVQIRSNIANPYAAAGIMFKALVGMLAGTEQPRGRIITPS